MIVKKTSMSASDINLLFADQGHGKNRITSDRSAGVVQIETP